MSNRDQKPGTEVGGGSRAKTPATTYVVSPDASKNTSSTISMSEYIRKRRALSGNSAVSPIVLAGSRS